jgi:DUF4097 and DUF4098 domain-containing protein YvlB
VASAKVEYSVRADEAGYYNISVDPNKGGLAIKTSLKRRIDNTHGVDFKIILPKKFSLELDSEGGGLSIENLEGTFSGKTMGGEVKLIDSDLDGSLKTMGGEVLFRNVTGDVDGSSLGGLVRYENVKDRSGRYRAPERIADAGITAKTVLLSTMGGEIEVEDAPEGAKVHKMGGPVRIINAKKFVHATTMGGDIRIKVKDGWVKATTMAGDITADVENGLGGGSEGISLESMTGDIILTIPAGLSLNLDLTISYTKKSDQNYRIISDFPVKEERTKDWVMPEHGGNNSANARKYIHGKSAAGGGTIAVVVKTINGNITIRKAR